MWQFANGAMRDYDWFDDEDSRWDDLMMKIADLMIWWFDDCAKRDYDWFDEEDSRFENLMIWWLREACLWLIWWLREACLKTDLMMKIADEIADSIADFLMELNFQYFPL